MNQDRSEVSGGGTVSANLARGPAGVVARNVAMIAALEEEALAHRSRAERFADRLARMTGTPLFALIHLVGFGAWLLINVGWVPAFPRFDPFPFSFLTLAVSLEAIFLSVLVLISQNGMTRQADRRAHLDLQINLLAEQESTRTLALLERIAARLGVPGQATPDQHDLAVPTDVHNVITTLQQELPE